MKKILLFIISIIFILTLTSCTDDELNNRYPYDIPKFNEAFTIANTDINCTITNNIEEQRFEFALKIKKIRTHKNNHFLVVIRCFNESRNCSYSWFSSDSWREGLIGGDSEKLELNGTFSNRSAVEVIDDDFYINGDTTFYLSYKNLDADMKEIFLNKNFDSYNSGYEIRNTDNNNYYMISVNVDYLYFI